MHNAKTVEPKQLIAVCKISEARKLDPTVSSFTYAGQAERKKAKSARWALETGTGPQYFIDMLDRIATK